MPDYQQSKIYCIRSNETSDVYIGSTTLTLSKRMAHHRHEYKIQRLYYSAFEVLKYTDAYIELIELFPCDTKEQLNKREGELIRSMPCVNIQVAGRTKQEWYHETREHIVEQQQCYRQAHKKEILAYNQVYQRQYRKQNREIVLEKQREYRRKRKQLRGEK